MLSLRRRHRASHATLLGGKPLPAVSPLCCGCSLPLLTAEQVRKAVVGASGTRASILPLLLQHLQLRAHLHQKFSCFSFLFSMPRCCLAPASAAKFQDALLRAGLVLQLPPEITALRAMETRSTPLERGQDWAQALREQIEAMARRRGIAGQGVTQT